jgi:hypothetical protein
MAYRLPVIVLTGPADDLKVLLAKSLDEVLTSFAFMSETTLGVEISRLDRVAIDGCMCCVGAVTLMTHITRLLRVQRNDRRYEGLLLVAGAQTKTAELIDLLRQPLLNNLISVSKVIYANHRLMIEQSEELAAADIVYSGRTLEQQVGNSWLLELPGWQQRVFLSDQAHLQHFVLSNTNTNTISKATSNERIIWPETKIFDRQSLKRLFDQAYIDGLRFDAVFRTQRAWYRWTALENSKYPVHMRETTFRHNSYLHCYPTKEAEKLLLALKHRIESEDLADY